MKTAIAALSAMLLLTGTASAAQSQDPAGAPSSTGTTKPQIEPSRDLRRPDTRPVGTDNLRDQLLQGAINTILRPRRPRPPPIEPTPPVIVIPDPAPPVILEPATPATPAATQVEPVRPARPVATPKVVPAAQPAPPKAAESPPAPRPAIEPIAPASVPAPLPVETAPVAAAPEIAPPPAPLEAPPTPILAPQPTMPAGLWLLLALVAVVVAAATVYARRARQISRTRAALSLNPSLDLLGGSCSASGLALARPPVSVRARLDDGGARVG